MHGNDQAYQNWFLLLKCPLQTAIFKRLSLKEGTGNGERGTGTNYETPTPCNSAYKKRLKAENNSVHAFTESTVTTVYLDLFTAVNVYFLLRVLHQETVRNKSNICISLTILYILSLSL